MATSKPSQLATDVAQGLYANDAERFQLHLDAAIQSATGRIANVSSWAQNQLQILADMATDRGIEWVANTATRIREGLEKP